jgi:hypothetical protein
MEALRIALHVNSECADVYSRIYDLIKNAEDICHYIKTGKITMDVDDQPLHGGS